MEKSDNERTLVIRTFYHVYRQLQEKYNLMERSHFDVYGHNVIEIWECEEENGKYCVCRVSENDEIECYRRAIQILRDYSKNDCKRCLHYE